MTFFLAAIIVSCLASFRSLFTQQDSRAQPIRYRSPALHSVFLQGSKSGKDRRGESLDSLIDVGLYEKYVRPDVLESKTNDPHNSSRVFITPLQAVHIKEDVDIHSA